VLIAIIMSFVADIATRFCQGDFDLISAVTIVFPTLLALLSVGGLFSSTLQEGIDRAMQRLRIRARYQHEAREDLSCIVLAMSAQHGHCWKPALPDGRGHRLLGQMTLELVRQPWGCCDLQAGIPRAHLKLITWQ
jgi:hypothetical protein